MTMMDRVLIADDEQNIREGLKLILPWEEMGFTVCGDAADGEETLRKILLLSPELVLIDLNMPGMNGIEVIRKAREEGFSGSFVILTGYSEFSYAQAAIRYGVTDYIVKPIDEDKLAAAVTAVHDKLEKERSARGNIVRMRGKAKRVILRELLSGEGTPGQDYSADDLASLGLTASTYRVVLYEIYRGGRLSDKAFRLPELLTAWIEEAQFESLEIDGRGVIILKGRLAVTTFSEFLQKLGTKQPEKYSPLDLLYAACGRCTSTVAGLADSYQDALRLSQRRYFCAPGQHVVEHEQWMANAAAPTDPTELTSEDLAEIREALIRAVETGSSGLLTEELDALGSYVSRAEAGIADVRLFLTDLCIQTKEKITKAHPDTAADFESNSVIIDYGYTCFYLYEYLEQIRKTALKIMDRIKTQGAPEGTIAEVLVYIDHNYEKNLTLETIAPKFGYNNVYFGKLFTRTTGTSFNTYLNTKRITEAKKLLCDPSIRMYDVARRVGYSDVDYFTRRFRKECGMSPAEYRKMRT